MNGSDISIPNDHLRRWPSTLEPWRVSVGSLTSTEAVRVRLISGPEIRAEGSSTHTCNVGVESGLGFTAEVRALSWLGDNDVQVSAFFFCLWSLVNHTRQKRSRLPSICPAKRSYYRVRTSMAANWRLSWLIQLLYDHFGLSRKSYHRLCLLRTQVWTDTYNVTGHGN